MLWLPVPKPPCFAQIAAACGVARYFTNARMAGVSRKVTIRSPAISTAFAFAPAVIWGQTNVLNPVLGFALVCDRITPPTKSASNTIAAFGGDVRGVAQDLPHRLEGCGHGRVRPLDLVRAQLVVLRHAERAQVDVLEQ